MSADLQLRPTAALYHTSRFAFDDGVVLLDEEAGRLYALNGTADTIWTALSKGFSETEVADLLAEVHGIARERALSDVVAVRQDFNKRSSDFALDARRTETAAVADIKITERCYDISGTCFSIVGSLPEVMHQVASVLSAFERIDGEPTHRLFVLRDQDAYVVAMEGGCRRFLDTAAEAIGAVFQTILELKNPDLQWLGIMHGASVSLEGRGILLAGASGSGKSTLAAHLSKNGFTYHSDDMIALSGPEGDIVPWPVPHSLKEGCWSTLAPVLPGLSLAPEYIIAGRKMRYVLADTSGWDHPPVSSRALFFPRYKQGARAALECLSPMSALVRLMDDRLYLGYPLTPSAVQEFLEWLQRTPAYALTYSDSACAEAMIRSTCGA